MILIIFGGPDFSQKDGFSLKVVLVLTIDVVKHELDSI